MADRNSRSPPADAVPRRMRPAAAHVTKQNFVTSRREATGQTSLTTE